ncbi:MAG TPA: 4-hydroxy-tetrahydrodipicolinate synthase [bacterium]|nr:4-hydroxy-tetrahydrodipicolinate synthase [bacterium]
MKKKLRLSGSMTALVTPWKHGKLDEPAFVKLVEEQIEKGTKVLVPMGTTGESATASHEEQLHVISLCVKTARGRVPVVGGSGKNATEATIEMTRAVKETGADGALVVTPYYNKPSQEGLYRHFVAVADAVEIPVLLYNVPGRTGVNMTAETVSRLADHARIIGVKEASGDLVQAAEIVRTTPKEFQLISGEDALTFPMMVLGATGVISVASNVVPDLMAKMVDAALAENWAVGRELHLKLLPLMRGIFMESSPAPTKYLLKKMGKMEADLRLPLVHVSSASEHKLDALARELGLTL